MGFGVVVIVGSIAGGLERVVNVVFDPIGAVDKSDGEGCMVLRRDVLVDSLDTSRDVDEVSRLVIVADMLR